jgi:hypothetical protein
MSRPSTANDPTSGFSQQMQNDMNQIQFPSGSSTSSFDQIALASFNQQQQQQQQQQLQQQLSNVSPESMFNVSGSDPSSAQTQGQMDSMQLFGNAMMDQFDFSDLGLGAGVQNNTVESSFNPFDLAQAEDT